LLSSFFSSAGRDLLKIHSRPNALIVRSLVGTVSLLATFKAFNFLPMADAQALFFTSSLFIPVLGYFFLNEQVARTAPARLSLVFWAC